MKVVLQRVSQASVTINQEKIAAIGQGLVLLVGIKVGDTENEVDDLARKISQLRIFEDAHQKMNLSIKEIKGEILSISQFTLLATTKKGNRPSFINAEKADLAMQLYHHFNQQLRQYELPVKTGEFGADMHVSLINDGPVTLIMDTEK